MSAEEIDLTTDTPPKKMKQARLPFASLDKVATSPQIEKELGRKRKLSTETETEDENLTPNKKSLKKDEGKNDFKSKLSIFARKEEPEIIEKKDDSGDKVDDQILQKVSKKPKITKKKSKKSVQSQDDDEEKDITGEGEIKGKESSKFSGLLKMPFKKSKKTKEEKEKVSQDDEDSVDLELVLDSSAESGTLTEEASITSMTEEWVKYHENNESMEVEASVQEEAKKIGKKTKASVSKKAKPEGVEKAKVKDKEDKPIEAKAKVENSKKSTSKLNPLAKFFGKAAKETDAKPENEVVPCKAEAGLGEKKTETVATSIPPQATSTPLTTSPRKIEAAAPEPVKDVAVTPLRTSPRKKIVPAPPVSTPDPDRAQKLNIAKLKVRQTELNIAMEKAVEDKDFLKAHETKEAIKKIEVEIAAMEADTSYVSQSLETSKIEEKTPKTSRNRNVSVVSTPGSAKITPGSKMTKKEKLEKERQEKREALEKEKQAKKEALEKEKLVKQEAKEKERVEKERLKEAERKAKEEERLDKERIKKAEKEKAEEEKLKLKQEKEEEKLKQKQEREEERLRKKAEKEAEAKQREEEKRQQEEAEKEKAKKTAQAFTSFFKKAEPKAVKESVQEEASVDESANGFTPFRVKENMKMAPLVRGDPQKARDSIDSLDMPSGPDGMYLALLKKGHAVGRQGRTWPYEKSDCGEKDVEIIDDDEESDPEDILDETDVNIIMRKGGEMNVKIPRAKLLKFHENRRPAYWGTWTKASKMISGRRPFAMDEERFEYDYDSDDDWEEEEEGESLSDDEKDKEDEDETEKDDYEVDNEFFVPHGYLSDEEEDKEEDEVLDPETAKQKQKLAAKEFEKEHKKKTQELKPRLWGTYWTGEAELDTGAAAMQLAKILGGFTGIVFGSDNNNPIGTSFNKTVSSPTVSNEEVTDSVKATKSAKLRNLPEEAVEDLVKLVHRNPNNKIFLAKEFIAFWDKKSGFEEETETELATPSAKVGSLSKKKVMDKINEIAEYKKPSEGASRCWCVKEEVLAKFDVSPGSGPAEWTYILEQPNNKTSAGTEDLGQASSRPESPAGKVGASPAPTNLITKFARVLTEKEKEEQRVRREKEAAAAKQKREAAKVAAALKAAEAKTASQVAEVNSLKTEAGQTKSSPLARFTQQLSEMQRVGQMNSGGDNKKRVTLTAVTPTPSPGVRKGPLKTVSGVKNNPITAITTGPPNVTVSPIAVKRKPGPSASAKASPIAIKRKPGREASSSTSPCFKGLVPNGVTVTHVSGGSKTAEKKTPVECVTIEDSN